MATDTIRASAPGKVVLSGEYAVLDGAPAVCMAVNRRARVTVGRSEADHHTVVAPGHVDAVTRFRSRDGCIEWLDDGRALGLLEHVWQAADWRPATGVGLTLDTTRFIDTATRTKIGIGSSAALAVALARAVCERVASATDAVEIAHRGHRAFQSGLGSGVDIAAAATGGLVRYEMTNRTVTPIDVPAGLKYRLLWSGSPVATGRKLSAHGQNSARPSRAALAESALRIADAWSEPSAAAVLREYRDYIDTLKAFSTDHGLGIFDAGHAELHAAAAVDGLVYKPCGAGGGDIGVVLGDDTEALDTFVERRLPKSFRATDLELEVLGAEVTGAEP